MSVAWVVEFRESPRYRWTPESIWDTKREAQESMWQAVPPAEFRIMKYARVERKVRAEGR